MCIRIGWSWWMVCYGSRAVALRKVEICWVVLFNFPLAVISRNKLMLAFQLILYERSYMGSQKMSLRAVWGGSPCLLWWMVAFKSIAMFNRLVRAVCFCYGENQNSAASKRIKTNISIGASFLNIDHVCYIFRCAANDYYLHTYIDTSFIYHY